MDSAEIQGTYGIFVDTLRAGGFTEPDAGWDDGGRIVRDEPIPIRAFIEGNATFHLQLHLDQLRGLLP